MTNFGFTPGAQVDFDRSFSLPNQLKFTSSGQQEVAAVGDEFLIGVISYTNGNWYPGTSSFHVRFTTSSSNLAFNGQILDDSITQLVTPNDVGQTPLQNADFIYFTNHPGLGSVRVFDAFDSPGNNTGTVKFYGKIGSLIPTRFADATGGATIVPSIDANLVPEPSTYVLLLAGLGILVVFGRRRSNGQALNA